MKDYSQHGEQAHILYYFKDQPEGNFLDIGAYDGITFSNTRALLEQPGWNGVAIEASPLCFSNLVKNLEPFNVIKLCALLYPSHGPGVEHRIVKFYDSQGDALGTSNDANTEIWKDRVSFKEIWLPAISIFEFTHYFTINFDFINIDVEGGSADLFEEIAKTFNYKMICVEYDDQLDRCNEIASLNGLEVVHRNGVNVIYGR